MCFYLNGSKGGGDITERKHKKSTVCAQESLTEEKKSAKQSIKQEQTCPANANNMQ